VKKIIDLVSVGLLAAGAEAPGRHADRVRRPLAVRRDAEKALKYSNEEKAL
jgi:hypothetical protein